MGRVPPPPQHLRRPLPGGGMVHPDPFGSGLRGPPPGPFPAFDMLPPPEILEQKLAGQHVEIQRLVTENQRLAATHVSLRQELAAAQHELQMLHNDIGVFKGEREQQMRGLMDNIAKMEAELKAAESIKSELQQARAEAEKLVGARQELMSNVHKLTQDLHRAHTDAQQIPVLISEHESLRYEYQRLSVAFDYEKKLLSDHRESLQAMENSYVTMAREVEKLRLELANRANADIRTAAGVPYGGATGSNENETSGRTMGQTKYEDGYGVPQVQGQTAIPGNSGSAAVSATASANVGTGAGTPTYTGAQSGSVPVKSTYDPQQRGPNYDVTKVPGYDPSRGSGYDAQQRVFAYDAQSMQRGPGYDTQRGTGYDTQQRVFAYDAQRIPGYAPRVPGYDMQQVPHYDLSRVPGYDPAARGAAVPPHGQVAPGNNVAYGSATPPTRAVSGYEAPARGENPVRR
ncbi:protein FLX-like 2 isoform X2 [Mercurialis annua]|uniref:protein FLX-like 2 isoform X2 n=1 Tax=Mercurialis annua TaxID=3986 RepID=UPI00215F75CE|nr:protein FLX-like 2 isoform X2 [Mercurialis annua]